MIVALVVFLAMVEGIALTGGWLPVLMASLAVAVGCGAGFWYDREGDQ